MDVTLPDGRVLQGVPDGTTKAQLLDKLKSNGMDVSGLEAKPAKAAPKAEKAAPKNDPAGFILGNLNEGIAGVAGLGVDAIANVADLAKAAAGTVQSTVTGKPPSEMFDPMDRSKVVGSSEYISNAMRGAGVINPEATDPTSSAGKVAASALRAIPSIMAGGEASPGQLARAAGGAAASGGLAGGAKAAGLDPATQQLAGMLPGAAHQGVATGREALRQKVTGGSDVASNVAEANRAGISNPDPAAVTGSKSLAQFTSTMQRIPGGGSKLGEAIDKRTAGLQNRTGQIADDLGGSVSAEKAGNAVQAGAEGAVTAFKARQKQLYTKVDSMVAPDKPVDVSKLSAILDKLGSPIQGAEATSKHITSPKLADIRQGLQADLANSQLQPPGPTRPALQAQSYNTIPYKAASQLRSRIGELFEGGPLPEGITKGQLKQVYRALTDDMRTALPPSARAAWDRANNYTRLGHDRIDNVYGPLIEKNTPEKALKAAFSGTREGSSSFRKIMGALTPQQRDTVGAHVIENMGKAGAGRQNAGGDAFSAETFLTNYNKLDPGARNALFTSPATRRDVETIANAISRTREAYAGSANPSGTGKANTHAGFYGAGATGVIIPLMMGDARSAGAMVAALGGEVALNHYVSRALTSPEFVKWLAEGTKAPVGDRARYAARLGVIADNTRDEETKEALRALHEAVSGPAAQTEGK